METSRLMIGVTVNSRPEQVFAALTDSLMHSEFTRGISEIDARIGGRFSYFGGVVTGVFRDIEPGNRIVQELHAAGWPEGHFATVSQELKPLGDGNRTYIRVTEEDIPVTHLDDVMMGWQDYWEAFSNYLRERKVDVVKKFVAEYKNNHNPNIVDELVTQDCIVHIPLPGLPQGREGMRNNGAMVCAAFPDVKVTTEFLVAEDDIVIERASAVATHRGELVGIAPTEQPVTWTELHAYRVTEGMIAEVWTEADFMGIMGQIGAISLPGMSGEGS